MALAKELRRASLLTLQLNHEPIHLSEVIIKSSYKKKQPEKQHLILSGRQYTALEAGVVGTILTGEATLTGLDISNNLLCGQEGNNMRGFTVLLQAFNTSDSNLCHLKYVP